MSYKLQDNYQNSHRALVLNLRPLQSNGNTVEKYKCKYDVVKELVCNNCLTSNTKPIRGKTDILNNNIDKGRMLFV